MRLPILLAAIILLSNLGCSAQDTKEEFRVAFYNVENLFDTLDDPNKLDEEFTPFSSKKWTAERYQKKLNDTASVIQSLNGDDFPEIIGLCEVENRQVVEDLVNLTVLKDNGYKVVHQESPDKRGIDVAMIYEEKYFTIISHEAIGVTLPGDRPHTRDILYVMGNTGKETLHLFVNHWPSRYGGAEQSDPKRVLVAGKVREKIDAIQQEDEEAKILVMGDLNDYPINKSTFEVLRAKSSKKPSQDGDLYNMMYDGHEKGLGSHNYKGDWGMLDQIIVSYSLLNSKKGLSTKPGEAIVHKEDFFLFEKKDGTKIPNRTFGGKNYYGGFSDHLPVMVTLKNK